MKTKAQILAENPSLISYRVMLHEEKGDKFQIAFDCFAEDADSAADQAQNAYPNGEVLTTTPDCGNDDEPFSPPQPGIDWPLLRTQKNHLVAMAMAPNCPVAQAEVLDGVVNLLDSIQDNAVAKGQATEAEVFGSEDEAESINDKKRHQFIVWVAGLDHGEFTNLDQAHTVGQLLREHLNREVWITDGLFRSVDPYVVYSPNEAATTGYGAGFWNNDDGWTDFANATRFSESEKNAFNLPISTGQDAAWTLESVVYAHCSDYNYVPLSRFGVDTVTPGNKAEQLPGERG